MKKINYLDSVRNPIITEKATILSDQNKTVFKVHEGANKKTIKKNIEKLFKVNVIKVNIINQKSKFKSTIFLVLSQYFPSGSSSTHIITFSAPDLTTADLTDK